MLLALILFEIPWFIGGKSRTPVLFITPLRDFNSAELFFCLMSIWWIIASGLLCCVDLSTEVDLKILSKAGFFFGINSSSSSSSKSENISSSMHSSAILSLSSKLLSPPAVNEKQLGLRELFVRPSSLFRTIGSIYLYSASMALKQIFLTTDS